MELNSQTGTRQTIRYIIVDDEYRIGDHDELNVTIADRIMVAISRTRYLRCEIPEGGFRNWELTFIMFQLGVSEAQLLRQLNRPEFMGVAGPAAASREYAMNNRSQFLANFFDGLRNVPLVLPPELIQRNVPHLLTADSVAGDETCAICLDEKGDNPSQPWATSAGCALHRFHLKCIERWSGGTCPTCRAPSARL